ncbi:ATPase, T2SS/T4P/T4SS family [Niveispirillum sp. SYP-B3756]|uniref:type IV pilus twitching motility protein PilT n=1 Tax=Niveispirillum sp. SYP-B3756 TaxID=2662178 RepID=UPI001567A278|nr:ATPase, T2SS/T4P/T4SS family [Niveispirillum sp. SYP-B3756]
MDQLLLWSYDINASDVSIQTGEPVWIEVDGVLRQATDRALRDAEVQQMAIRVYRSEAGLAQLAKGQDWDESYQLRRSRLDFVRFRVNATGILVDGRDGIDLTFRVIKQTPPPLSDQLQGDQAELLKHLFPKQGLVLTTGETGSGKSTLQAGVVRHLLEAPEWSGRIVEYASPIEYTFGTVRALGAKIAQVQIPRGLPSWAAATKNALRRKPAAAVFQEARDAESIAGMVELALTGTLVYATAHTTGVSATLQRMISGFEPSVRSERAAALVSVLRLVVTQRLERALVRNAFGGRIALREWLVFDDELRSKLLQSDLRSWTGHVEDAVRSRGRPMAVAARQAYNNGLIGYEQLLAIEYAHGRAL